MSIFLDLRGEHNFIYRTLARNEDFLPAGSGPPWCINLANRAKIEILAEGTLRYGQNFPKKIIILELIISFPHREMNAQTAASFGRSKVYIVYCGGNGCNASTKGPYKFARLGFCAKVLPGGRNSCDGHPVATTLDPGSILAAAA